MREITEREKKISEFQLMCVGYKRGIKLDWDLKCVCVCSCMREREREREREKV
jgi:hypothetical protein